MDALGAELRSQFGLHLQCSFLEAAVPAQQATHLSLEQQVQSAVAIFLLSDMNAAGSGCLPQDLQVRVSQHAILFHRAPADQPSLRHLPLQTWHNRVLAGRFTLQIDEMSNVAAEAKMR